MGCQSRALHVVGQEEKHGRVFEKEQCIQRLKVMQWHDRVTETRSTVLANYSFNRPSISVDGNFIFSVVTLTKTLEMSLTPLLSRYPTSNLSGISSALPHFLPPLP